jgi:hypothetical protein
MLARIVSTRRTITVMLETGLLILNNVLSDDIMVPRNANVYPDTRYRSEYNGDAMI